MDFNFKVDPETLTLRDLIEFEEMQLDKEIKAKDLPDIIARFLVDENGERVEREKAREIVLNFSVRKLKEAVEKIRAAALEVSGSKIPPEPQGK